MMHLTDYHAKYFAHELTKRCASDSVEKLAGTLVDAQVDLNPHQVEAALFAFKSPLSKGAILADEVGLGKTIEAGLVLSQKWAERKRRLLVITPANLRKQWYQELQEKFFLPCRILEAKFYNASIKQGNGCPFHAEDIITHRSLILETNWEIWKFSFQRDNEFNIGDSSLDRLELWREIGGQLSQKSREFYKLLKFNILDFSKPRKKWANRES